MPMRRGTSTNSNRSNIWEYVEGEQLNCYSRHHAAFVSRHLRIQDGLQISRSEIAALYLDWIRNQLGRNLQRPDRRDLHNLNLHLLVGQGVDEDGEIFIGVGRRN